MDIIRATGQLQGQCLANTSCTVYTPFIPKFGHFPEEGKCLFEVPSTPPPVTPLWIVKPELTMY